MFECMDVAEKLYGGVTPSKTTTNREDDNRDIHERKRKRARKTFLPTMRRVALENSRKLMQAI